jgi:hypothetical protein
LAAEKVTTSVGVVKCVMLGVNFKGVCLCAVWAVCAVCVGIGFGMCGRFNGNV